MKNFLLYVLLFSSLTMLFYSFKENKELRLANSTSFFVSKGSVNPREIKLNWLHSSKAAQMVEEYSRRQYQFITQAMNRNMNISSNQKFYDSRLVTFSLDTIKALINTMDSLVMMSSLLKADGTPVRSSDLGLKMYFGTYPGYQEGMDPNTKIGHHTLILVPSYLDESVPGRYTDFYPLNSSITVAKPHVLISSFAPKKIYQTSNMSVAPQNDLVIGLNQGGSCPPPGYPPDTTWDSPQANITMASHNIKKR